VAAPVIDARDEILARIRDAIAGAGAPEAAPYEPVREDVDVTALFVERVADYDVGVRIVSVGAIAGALADICGEHDAHRVAVSQGFPDAWAPAGVDLVRDDGLAYDELDRLDGALTGSALAIAETGTIVLDHGPTQGRRALTLVPDLHVCVVDAGAIVARVPDAFERIRADGPMTFVSGPSATSDIELSRVRGVHGPRRLEVVIAQR
jgi:L-lactate dehydrogenase complex protein LldG